ncbi:MAG: DUF3006 domain-containing protein [Bacillota bacterium]|nr:DUF3006 domain-containing protein [Bacillota bacterium]
MKKLIFDRFENGFGICEDKEKRTFAIPLDEMPKEVKKGDVIEITDEGEISINQEETKRLLNEKKAKQSNSSRKVL